MTQKAAAADYDLWVNGTPVTDENKADIPFDGTGKASYDDSTKTLTFENAVFTNSDYPVIQAQDDLIVTGQVQYTGTKGGILADKSLTIVGSDTNVNVTAPTAIIAGSLTVEDGIVTASGGIETTGEIVINGGNVTAKGNLYGIYAAREATGAPHNITISGGTVTASQSENGSFGDSGAAIRATGDVIISGGKVEATADGKYAFAILADGDNGIDISGAEVKAAFTAYDGTGLQANAGDVKISNSSKVDIPCTADTGFRGIFTPNGGVFISGGSEVKITGPAFGIYAALKNVEVTGEKTVLTVNNGLGESILSQGAGFVVKDATVDITNTDDTASAVYTGSGVEFENADVTVHAANVNLGISANGSITITNSVVDVTAKETGIEGKSVAISGASTVVKTAGSTAAITANSGIITISAPLEILKPTDGKLGTDSKHVYQSDGTTVATSAEIAVKATAYPLWVGGVQATSANKDDILSDGGSAKYDPATSTLTLNNADITGSYSIDGSIIYNYNIYAEGIDLTVNGSAKLTTPSDDGRNYYEGLRVRNSSGKGGNLTLNADITADCFRECIDASGNIDIIGGKLDLTTRGPSCALSASSSNHAVMTISDGIVKAESGQVAIQAGSVTIEGGKVDAKGDYGIWASDGNGTGITITGGEVLKGVYGAKAGTSATNNTITMSGGKVNNVLYGGYADSATGITTGNTVTLYGTADVSNAGVFGGNGSDITGNVLNIGTIINDVAQDNGVTYDEIVSQKRSAKISAARKIAVKKVRGSTQLSLSEIGKFFGGRDHSTIVHLLN